MYSDLYSFSYRQLPLPILILSSEIGRSWVYVQVYYHTYSTHVVSFDLTTVPTHNISVYHKLISLHTCTLDIDSLKTHTTYSGPTILNHWNVDITLKQTLHSYHYHITWNVDTPLICITDTNLAPTVTNNGLSWAKFGNCYVTLPP